VVGVLLYRRGKFLVWRCFGAWEKRNWMCFEKDGKRSDVSSSSLLKQQDEYEAIKEHS